jgi:hypothetical protein
MLYFRNSDLSILYILYLHKRIISNLLIIVQFLVVFGKLLGLYIVCQTAFIFYHTPETRGLIF